MVAVWRKVVFVPGLCCTQTTARKVHLRGLAAGNPKPITSQSQHTPTKQPSHGSHCRTTIRSKARGSSNSQMRASSTTSSLLAAVARCASNTHIPDCLPSTSSACWSVWARCTRGSVTTAAVASPQVQPQPSLDVDYARRINEMLAAQAPQQRQQEQQQLEQLQRRRLDLDSIPVLQLPRQKQQQQSQQQRKQAQPQQPQDADKLAVDWRQVVEHVRRSGQTVTGQQMLTDKFRRTHTYLRISLTERCNLRCTYCMPADGVDLTPSERLMSPDEVERLARLFVKAGVTKIRLTGGEPTVRRDLLEIVSRLQSLKPLGLQTIAMTSNGLTLAKQLPALQAAGLSTSGLNISLDSLRPERFEQLTRRRGHHKVMESIHTAVQLGFDPVKVNVVVMRGVNDDEVSDFVELTRHAPVNVRFIEYMPFDGNAWGSRKMVPYRELMAAVNSRFPEGLVRHADPAGEVAKNFSVPGFKGSVSFITSMTHAFCGDCNRLRLLADGALKVCLFGANEVSLRDAVRGGATDDELAAVISAAVDNKKAAHAGMEVLAVTQNRPMITIGG